MHPPPTSPAASLLTILLTLLTLLPPITAQTRPETPKYLNITALTYRGNTSILQCWSLIPPFSTSTSGPVGASAVNLGSVTGNATFIIQAPGSVGGYKNAPRPQFSWFITGLGHITLPYSPDRLTNPSITETWITGGRYGLVYADDVYTDGHLTSFPSDQETILLGLPTAGGRQPEHMVVREGGCRWEDLVGG